MSISTNLREASNLVEAALFEMLDQKMLEEHEVDHLFEALAMAIWELADEAEGLEQR